MPVKLLNNYPENNLKKNITNKDGSPLFGAHRSEVELFYF